VGVKRFHYTLAHSLIVLGLVTNSSYIVLIFNCENIQIIPAYNFLARSCDHITRNFLIRSSSTEFGIALCISGWSKEQKYDGSLDSITERWKQYRCTVK